ncbi:hypothetical protein jhhlp_004406 [Lomentospora prolificans]|uniref:Acid phosphatase-like protein n=1 Tax=Lomentospora prolificans TaxID=41688 RepID=A0A2N3NBF3_9PEZI|nr:hypothetical protein jhhlp_004406 [Lomentospora prolificans]
MVNTAGGIVIAVVVIAIVAALGWVVFTQLRARRLGWQLPPPSFSSYIPFMKSNDSPFDARPARGGVVGWFNDRVRDFKHRGNRSARGAYEPSGGGAARGNFGPLDPDEAWDSRVHDEYGYYEERELGNTSYPGGAGAAGNNNRLGDDLGDSGYEMNLPRTPNSRSPAPQEERRGRQPAERNPFDDDAEPSNISVRKMSPRPLDTSAVGPAGKKDNSSPTDRRSVFREDM